MPTKFVKKFSAWLMTTLCLIGLMPTDARAWGREGHQVVARIAARHLTAKTKTALLNLLQADPNDLGMCKQKNKLEDQLACVSVWADDARKEPEFASTAGLHFVNIPTFVPSGEQHYDAARDCVNGNCVIGGIAKYRAILADKSQSNAERALALKFIVHFIGDMHQPLHTAQDHDQDAKNVENQPPITDKGDRGGNLKLVTWLGESASPFGCWNLHAVWDDGILEHNQASDLALTQTLDAALTPKKLSALQKGTTIDWVNEAFALSLSKAYKLPAPQASDKVCEVKNGDKRDCDTFSPQVCGANEVHYRYHLDNGYFTQNLPTVKAQLTSAGARLAKFLNDIFDPKG